MPRIKPPPARPELPEIEDHTPPVEAVEIELSGDDSGETEVELAPQSTPKPESAPVIAAAAEENPLQKALDAQKRAEDLQRAAEVRANEAQRQAHEREQELDRERGDREDAQYNSVLTSIAAETSTIAKAEADYAAYASAGDWTNAAAAQRLMATASARLDRLEDGKQAFESKRESGKTEPPARQPQPPQDFEAKLAAIPGIPDNAKTWLRKHPEFVNDSSMNKKIGAAHNYLTDVKSVAPFSEAYFDALDDQFGFKTATPAPESEPQPQPQRRSMPMSAPVSRDVPTPSGQRQPSSKVTLTAEERQIARTSFTATDLSNEQKELLYARNKQLLQKRRANGEYPQSERN